MSIGPPHPEASTRSSARPVLRVRFTGGGLGPEQVPFGTLARAISAINRLAAAESPTSPKRRERSGPGPFHLIGVRDGPADYIFGGPDAPATLERLRGIGEALDDPTTAAGLDVSLRALADLSALATRHRCQIHIEGLDGEIVRPLVQIGPESAKTLENLLLIEGETSLFGHVMRVGGVTEMRCSIRLPSQDAPVHCRVADEDLARRLGRFLYREVAFHGRVAWLRSNWRVVRFMIHAIERPRRTDLVAAFEEIRRAGGSDWDAIRDPESFLELDRSDG